jgi:hypothetical protein
MDPNIVQSSTTLRQIPLGARILVFGVAWMNILSVRVYIES